MRQWSGWRMMKMGESVRDETSGRLDNQRAKCGHRAKVQMGMEMGNGRYQPRWKEGARYLLSSFPHRDTDTGDGYRYQGGYLHLHLRLETCRPADLHWDLKRGW